MFLMMGCTVNGKKVGDMMGNKVSEPKEENIENVEDATTVPESKESSSSINFKWANKEYHDGKEDINFDMNKKED